MTMLDPSMRPDRLTSYFRREWRVLLAVTLSGLIYNVGLLAGPLFEGKLAQALVDILGNTRPRSDMPVMVLAYVAVTLVVQGARYVKRRYVRRFANDVSRSMKHVLYANLLHKRRDELASQQTGSIMTKAIADVDACAEGMRKFTTEVFDTGVALVGYACLMLRYDARLALLCLLFPPISYVLAEKMKAVVQRTGAASKEAAGQLNEATLDRVSHAMTYRIFGCESQRNNDLEAHLAHYEQAAVRANIWGSAMPPLYRIISLAGAVCILYFGARNVSGGGWAVWDIAAFTTFLSCFLKLAAKSSSAAKLFNAVQKAQVSWRRIQPLMQTTSADVPLPDASPVTLDVRGLGLAYPGHAPLFDALTFSARPGQLIGITGPVACGKSALGRCFLREESCTGEILLGGTPLQALPENTVCALVGYLGHDPELMRGSIRDNVLLGDEGDLDALLQAVCLDKEVAAMPDGVNTLIGEGGVLLSGGQQQRLALARTLAHPRPLLVLDDPFSALDRDTEVAVFAHLRQMTTDSVVLLISHRLYLFPQADQVLWMTQGQTAVSTHKSLMDSYPAYGAIFDIQQKGGNSDAAQQ